jgi:hypothetical protein
LEMKNIGIRKSFSIAIFITVVPLTVLAQNDAGSASGLSGRLQAGGLFVQTDSQLSTHGSNRHIEGLNEPADTQQMITGLVSAFLQYQFENGTAIYAGNPLEVGEGLSLAAGVSQPMASAGTLDLSLKWLPFEEVWKNPYQTERAREETGLDAYGLKVEWEEIGGGPWEMRYEIGRFDVDDDESGDMDNDLQRSGWTHDVGITYNLSLSPRTTLSPELAYTYADKEGLSNSYQGVKMGAILQSARPPWVLIGVVSGAFNQYRKNHPIFDKTRQESAVTVAAQVMRQNLFGRPNLFASLLGGYVWSDANIDFFDSQTVLGVASVGIQF